MSFDMNSINLTGRLTRDPELSTVGQKQTSVCKFSLAVGAGKDQTYFFDVQCWGKIAESVNSYTHKGTKVGVSGNLQQDSWEKDGQKRSRVIVNASSVVFLSAKSENTSQGSYQAKPPAEPDPFENLNTDGNAGNVNTDDSVPF
jgi:single-strand DNA-binding protein